MVDSTGVYTLCKMRLTNWASFYERWLYISKYGRCFQCFYSFSLRKNERRICGRAFESSIQGYLNNPVCYFQKLYHRSVFHFSGEKKNKNTENSVRTY